MTCVTGKGLLFCPLIPEYGTSTSKCQNCSITFKFDIKVVLVCFVKDLSSKATFFKHFAHVFILYYIFFLK